MPRNIRPHMMPDRHSEGYLIVIAIENMRDENERLWRGLPDLNKRIAANVHAVMERFDMTYDEFYMWSDYVKPRPNA